MTNINNNNILEQMNICRTYLKVIYISDICNAEGSKIEETIFEGNPIQSRYNWPETPKPPMKLWNTWKKI